ncbi:MAG TPA: CBS domain-containing protein [Methylomirabilota bacterium]|nr:CBS domain-containing protein [Methylomirabilota bacterium]
MLHLSEVLDLPVRTADGARIGRVEDLRVDTLRGQVDGLLVRRGKDVGVVAWSSVETFSPEHRRVILAPSVLPQDIAGVEGEAILLKRDVLDRQIIDIQGHKVVRVNDIMLDRQGHDLALRRVEIGLAGAVRRLFTGLLSPGLVRRVAAGLPEQAIPWDYVGLVEPHSSRIRLKVHQQLARMHPADLADIIEDLGRVERSAIVSQMAPEIAADALAEAEPSVQAAVVETMHTDQAADVLEEMQPDEAADVLGELPQERSQELLAAMEADEAKDVRELLEFGENTAGGLMTTDFFRAGATWSVEQTRARLREAEADLLADVGDIPVADEADRFVGVVALVHLVRAAAPEPLVALLRPEPATVTPAAPLREVVERFEKYHLRTLCVIDESGVLVGLISIEDVLRRLAPTR